MFTGKDVDNFVGETEWHKIMTADTKQMTDGALFALQQKVGEINPCSFPS